MADSTRPDALLPIVAAAAKIVEVRRQQQPEVVLERMAAARRRPPRFDVAPKGPRPAFIAECKRRSPSRGVLRADYHPAAIAQAYERAGAAAISVLTEPAFFDGDPRHLQDVSALVNLPVLRKDFIIDRYQLLEARAWGAAAVLLIVAVLSNAQLRALTADATSLDLDALIEVHDVEELSRAVDAGARVIGVNNRNLQTLEVNTRTALELIDRIPPGIPAVAESGIRTRDDVKRLREAGYSAVLIGERFMAAADPGQALAELLR